MHMQKKKEEEEEGEIVDSIKKQEKCNLFSIGSTNIAHCTGLKW